jgi:uridine kinase
VTVVERLAEAIDRLRPKARIIVAFDGPDAAGKTTMADAVAQRLARPSLRVSVDDWHHPREVRLQRGAESPDGYYLDSFDYEALTDRLLHPFRAGLDELQTSRFDFESDATSEAVAVVDSPCTALLIDGVFLLRPEFCDVWDLTVYLHVPEAVTLARAVVRDAGLLGGTDVVRARYERRYLPGQALYRDAASPLNKADIVIDNSDPQQPLVGRWSGGGGRQSIARPDVR